MDSCILLSRSKAVLLHQECAQGHMDGENLKVWSVFLKVGHCVAVSQVYIMPSRP